MTRRLADERLVLRPHYIGHRELATFRGTALVGFSFRTPETTFDRVRPRLEERLHVKRVALEAIGRLTDFLAVDEDRRKGVAVFEAKDDFLLREEVF